MSFFDSQEFNPFESIFGAPAPKVPKPQTLEERVAELEGIVAVLQTIIHVHTTVLSIHNSLHQDAVDANKGNKPGSFNFNLN